MSNVNTLLQEFTNSPDYAQITPKQWSELLVFYGKNYHFLECRAKGGEGFILLVEDLELSRYVILKITLPQQQEIIEGTANYKESSIHEISAGVYFRSLDIKSPTEFIAKLKEDKPISNFLRKRFTKQISNLILQSKPVVLPVKQFLDNLANEINQILSGSQLWQQNEFEPLIDDNFKEWLSGKDLKIDDLPKLNRILIEKAFPSEVAESNSYKTLKKESEFVKRFKRGCNLQIAMHDVIMEEALGVGYIPAIIKLCDKPTLFCEMEYIKGAQLMDWIKANPDTKDILSLLYKMLVIIEIVLHGHGIVHSDLKPDNWLVMLDGRPCLLDFNIAKNVEARQSSITVVNSAVKRLGSPLYASQNQQTNASERTYRDDIITLGRTMHSMLRGHEPHILKYSRNRQIDYDKAFPPDALQYDFREIFQKATKEDSGYYKSISEFRGDIENLLAAIQLGKTQRIDTKSLNIEAYNQVCGIFPRDSLQDIFLKCIFLANIIIEKGKK